jgi:mannose-6-phosphate isomerase-like protein (cupin superfamily)
MLGRLSAPDRELNGTREEELRMALQGPLVQTAAESRWLSLGPISARIVVSASSTEGAFGLIESPIEAGVLASPLHVHSNEDGWWYVLEGSFAAQIGETTVSAEPGSLVLAPKGIPHTYWNPGPGPARYLELFSPGGLERYFEQIASLLAADPPDIQTILELPASYGLELIWDSVGELQERHGVQLPGLPAR